MNFVARICPDGKYTVRVRGARAGGLRMDRLGWDARMLGFRLCLGDLQRQPVCHGYANACVCEDCKAREETPEPGTPVRQPWEQAA